MNHAVVSPAEWLKARKALLAREKELTRWRDELNKARLALPWVKVEKTYVFDATEGKVTLADSSTAVASSSSSISCGEPTRAKAASAARSRPIMSTAPCRISSITM